MHAFEKIRELVILDQYVRGMMEIISTGEKGNERKECQNIVQKLCVHTLVSAAWQLHSL